MRRDPAAFVADEPSGPVVLLEEGEEGAFIVSVVPPLPSGDHRQSFKSKDDAWQAARWLWSDHRIGLKDLTPGSGLRGPYRPRG